MIRKNLANLSFQTFFVSKEQCSCPLAFEIIKVGTKFKELLKETKGFISLGYGKRMLTHRAGTKINDLKIEDIIEVVDYDPLKKIMLVIGRDEPCNDSPVHWIIHHARDDVNAILQLNGEKIIERFSKKFPKTERAFPVGTLDLAKENLKALRNSKNIIIKDIGVMFVGANLKEVEDSFLKNIGGSSS